MKRLNHDQRREVVLKLLRARGPLERELLYILLDIPKGQIGAYAGAVQSLLDDGTIRIISGGGLLKRKARVEVTPDPLPTR